MLDLARIPTLSEKAPGSDPRPPLLTVAPSRAWNCWDSPSCLLESAVSADSALLTSCLIGRVRDPTKIDYRKKKSAPLCHMSNLSTGGPRLNSIQSPIGWNDSFEVPNPEAFRQCFRRSKTPRAVSCSSSTRRRRALRGGSTEGARRLNRILGWGT